MLNSAWLTLWVWDWGTTHAGTDLHSKERIYKYPNGHRYTHIWTETYTEVICYTQLCRCGSTDRSSYKYVSSTPSALLLSYYKTLMRSMRTRRWGERCSVFPQFCVCTCICVQNSHRNPIPLQMTPGTEQIHLSPGHGPDRHPLCASNNMNVFVCVMSGWMPGAVYRITSYFWSDADWSHPTQGSVCVQFPIALLLYILKLTRKPRILCSSLTVTGVEIFFNKPLLFQVVT